MSELRIRIEKEYDIVTDTGGWVYEEYVEA